MGSVGAEHSIGRQRGLLTGSGGLGYGGVGRGGNVLDICPMLSLTIC